MNVIGIFDALGERHSGVSGTRWLGGAEDHPVSVEVHHRGFAGEPPTSEDLYDQERFVGQASTNFLRKVEPVLDEWIRFGSSKIFGPQPLLGAIGVDPSHALGREAEPGEVE